jgi:hypothetical protein
MDTAFTHNKVTSTIDENENNTHLPITRLHVEDFISQVHRPGTEVNDLLVMFQRCF